MAQDDHRSMSDPRAEQREALKEAARSAKEQVPVPVPYTPRRVGEESVGVKYDSGKPRYELLMEMFATEEVVKGLTYGANGKYSRGNYKTVPGWRWRYLGASGRHITAYLFAKRKGYKGAEYDKESGCHHLALAICSLLMALDNELTDAPNGDFEEKKKDEK